MIIFTCRPHSWVDVITNSSSELFTCHGESKERIEELIKNVYPDYLKEYEPVKSIDELTVADLYTYLSYRYERWSNSAQKFIRDTPCGISKDDFWITIKSGINEYTTLNEEYLIENKEKIIDAIDPNREMFFLFSLSDNPDYEKQELLCMFMNRYHLG